jgi:hypothetical protein
MGTIGGESDNFLWVHPPDPCTHEIRTGTEAHLEPDSVSAR